MPTAPAIARRLGGPRRRRRRHVRFAIGAAVLLVLAAALIVWGGDEHSGFDDDAQAVCTEYSTRVQDEFRLSFPEGVPDDAAFAEYTSHAFADTMEELLAELTALDPPAAVAEIVDGYRAVLADIRERPADFVDANPFADLTPRFDTEGLPACGSDFFAASQ